MRSFNTAGPVNPIDHYLIAPLSRIDLGAVLGLVRDKMYFVLQRRGRRGRHLRTLHTNQSKPRLKRRAPKWGPDQHDPNGAARKPSQRDARLRYASVSGVSITVG